MRVVIKTLLLAPFFAFAFHGGPARAADASPETGRWITESGNLEVEIASCGDAASNAYCGTITRVIANNAMGQPGVQMAASNAPSPLGKRILFDLKPLAGGGWQGHIYNRENNKTYNSQLAAVGGDQLKLTIYEDTPAQGRVQVWRRAAQ
jgi:uncharacterized protein (DUF2147 family)